MQYTQADLPALALSARLAWRSLPEVLGVDARTLRRWRAQGRAPVVVVRFLEALAADLGGRHPDWAGWRLCGDGLLRDDGGNAFSVGDVRALWWYRAFMLDTVGRRYLGRLAERSAPHDDGDRTARVYPFPFPRRERG